MSVPKSDIRLSLSYYLVRDLVRGPTAVDFKTLTCDHSRAWRNQVEDSGNDIIDAGQSPQRDHAVDKLLELGIFEHRPGHWCFNKGRRHRVHPNALWR